MGFPPSRPRAASSTAAVVIVDPLLLPTQATLERLRYPGGHVRLSPSPADMVLSVD